MTTEKKEILKRMKGCVDNVIEAASYGCEDAVSLYIRDLGHIKFSNLKIVFDLTGEHNYASSNKDMIEKAVKEMSTDFQKHVSYIEDENDWRKVILSLNDSSITFQ